MAEKKMYIVTESFRYGGQSYLPGAGIELSVAVAAELAAFLQDAPGGKAVNSGASNQPDSSELADLKEQLEQYKRQLAVEATAKVEARTLLDQKEKEFTSLQAVNTKTAADLAAAKEKLAALGKELGALKKAANKEGGK